MCIASRCWRSGVCGGVCTVQLLIPLARLWYLWDVLDDVGVGILRQRLAVAHVLLSYSDVLVSWGKLLVFGWRLVIVIMGIWVFIPFHWEEKKKI